MKRLLCILSNMNAGGAETFLMKIYRKIDRTKYQFDFCINTREKCFYSDEIKTLGGRIYYIASKSDDLKQFKKQLYNVIYNEKYEYVIRITSNAMGFLDLKIAKQAGAKRCIARSSNSSDGDEILPKLLNWIGRYIYAKYVDVKIAPSRKAARYTFGNALSKVHILNNGIDLSEFYYDENSRIDQRKALNIRDDALVVGHIGRFNTQKNHSFLVNIFDEIQKRVDNCVLIMVGEGNLRDSIISKVKELGIENKVLFLGVRRDIPNLLSVMDVFVFPSFYEGMPNTVIEAQATGLPCVISDSITEEADITDNVKFVSLNESPARWAELAVELSKKNRENQTVKLAQKGYDIDTCASEFIKIVFGD